MSEVLDAPLSADQLVAQLNRDCFCIGVDDEALWREIAADPEDRARLRQGREHLFAAGPVFLTRADLAAMTATLQAIETSAALPGYRAAALERAPAVAQVDHGPRGAFMGYDFHLGPEGPRLIEVNTNAGGAFLNALLGRAQLACCPPVQDLIDSAQLDGFENAVWDMMLAEWRAQGRDGAPGLIAIIDEAPAGQYLYPEFRLAQRLFEARGARAVIADPAELAWRNGRLTHSGATVDLVYNRLVDFAFEAPALAPLRQAYETGAVVVTPNPHNHAMLADKRNLIALSDPDQLRAWGLAADNLAALAHVPRTVAVTAANAEALWADRKTLFFKPAGGYGGKAVYRGDKLTRGVWDAIRTGGYIAQALATPTERQVSLGKATAPRKLDVRLYAYAGRPILAAARLYQGQTTNFRTPGGGFAPVIVL
jgi:hypothetical protein